MTLNTRNDGASAPAAGQAQPLPLPRDGEGRAETLPIPRADEGRAVPLPAAPRVGDAPREAAPPSPSQEELYSITKPALDYYYDRAEDHFVRLNHMGAALKLAARDLKARIVKHGRVFDLKPPTAFESYLESRAPRRRSSAPQEVADVAARRHDWDEAKRSGDAGVMTTAANALIKAANDRQSDRTIRSIGETLNPSSRPGGAHEIFDIRELTEREPSAETAARLALLSPGAPQSDAEMRLGETARVLDHELYPISLGQPGNWVQELEQRLGREPAEGVHRPLMTTVGRLRGEAVPLSAPKYPPRRTDEFYDIRETRPARQKRYRTRDQTWEEWFWDWRSESWGGPKDKFTSEPQNDRPPFDTRAGYDNRLASRWGEVGRRFNRISGIDIDGESYTSTLMVGSNLDGNTAQGLSPEGIQFLASVLSDQVLRFRTAEEAADFVVAAERNAGKTVSPELRQQYIDTIRSGRGVTVGLLKKKGNPGDEDQTIILIDSAFDGLVPEGRRTAEALVLAHEIGHVASNVLKIGEVFEKLPAFERDRVAKEMERAFRASRMSQGFGGGEGSWSKSPKEWIAEVFMLYLTSPESAKRDAPLTCSILRSLWNKHPVLSQILRLS